MSERFVTRFAPSPTGMLHLGHAFSALTAWEAAKAAAGKFLLRIEDIDRTRSRPEYETAIYEDLAWLGVTWSGSVWRQSERLGVYAAALERLDSLGVTYPCRCTRADIRAALSAPQEGTTQLPPAARSILALAAVAIWPSAVPAMRYGSISIGPWRFLEGGR